MSLFSSIPYVVLGATFLIVLGLVVSVFRSTRARAASRRSPVCAACGYLMAGWRSSSCPECGADVRHAGVAGQKLDRSWRLQTFACGLLTALVVGWLSLVLLSRSFGRIETATDWRLGKSSLLERRVVSPRRGGNPISETWTLRPPGRTIEPGTTDPAGLLADLQEIDGAESWSAADLPFLEAVIAWIPQAAPPYPVSPTRTVAVDSFTMNTTTLPRGAYVVTAVCLLFGAAAGAHLGGRRFGVGWRIPADGEWGRTRDER